jgi:hypothetical protein
MTMKLRDGCVYLDGGRDKDGFRTWNVKHLVLSDAPIGPATALTCAGLPLPGEMYLFDDDIDTWAYCTLEAKVSAANSGKKHKEYWIEQPFSSNPNTKWCKDQQIDDPLLQPPKISGNFVRYTEEATFDRFGQLLLTSSWEKISGPESEFDADRIQIEIEQNVLDLNLPLLIAMSNTVNAYPLWGAAERIIKFNAGPWSMNFYGQCHKYFTRKLIFEAKKDGWDRVVLDEGSKVLAGDWPPITQEAKWNLRLIKGAKPNPMNPAHFIRFKDREGNYARTVLDGAGKPYIPSLVKVTKQCNKAPQSPNKWLVGGIVNDDDLDSPVILEIDIGCTWTASWEYEAFNFKTITLRYVDATDTEPATWEIVVEGFPSVWKLRHSQWKAFGPNVLVNSFNAIGIGLFPPDIESYPAKLTLSTGNFPGMRSIQKYEGSDFLLLGVPLLL